MKYLDHPLFLSLVFVTGCTACVIVAWVTITSYASNEPLNGRMIVFGLFWFWGAWSSGSRLFGFKPTSIRVALEEYISELMVLPFEDAVLDARAHGTQIPQELALRKIQPASKEWQAFEKDGLAFLIEKSEIDGRTIVTILP